MALFSLLGVALGFDSINIGETVGNIPKTTALWWAGSSIIATGIGAFVAGRLEGVPNPLTGMLHGLAVWAVSSLVVLWLAATAVGFAFGLASQAVSTATRVAGGAATAVGGLMIEGGGAVVSAVPSDAAPTRDQIRNEAVSIANQAGVGQQNVDQAQNAVAATARDIIRTPGDLPQDLNQLIDRLFRGPNAALTAQEQDRLVTVIVNRLGVSRDEAQQIAERWQVQAQAAWKNVRTGSETAADRVGRTAEDVGQKALDVTADLSWYMFWSSLAGLVAAMIGAAIAAATVPAPVAVVRDADYDDEVV